jgi:hypothetical protein
MGKALSDSTVQAEIEVEILANLQVQHPDWQLLTWREVATELRLPAVWQNAKPDAVWEDSDGVIIIAECYARAGELKAGHRRKLAMDILKLISLRGEIGDRKPLRLLMVVPEDLGKHLENNDWLSVVIRKELELIRVTLSNEQHQSLREAVRRQAEGQARRKRARITDGA